MILLLSHLLVAGRLNDTAALHHEEQYAKPLIPPKEIMQKTR